MDHVARLASEARELARRLLVASESHSSKLTRLFSTLLSSDVDIEALDKSAADNAGIGHTFAVMFLLAGVHGMPAIQGEDALAWVEKWKAANHGGWNEMVNKLSKALPRAYGSDIAGPIWSAAMQIAGKNRERAEDLVMGVLSNFLKGAGQSIKAEPIAAAIKYIQLSIRNMGINLIKKQDKRERSLTRETDEGEVEEELKSDHDLDDVMEDHHARMIVEEIMSDAKLKGELERVHIDALQYLHLLAQGFEDPEILGVTARGQQVGKPMLHHPLSKGTSGVPLTPQNWNVKKHQMFDIIKKHFTGGHHDLHTASSYNYDRSV